MKKKNKEKGNTSKVKEISENSFIKYSQIINPITALTLFYIFRKEGGDTVTNMITIMTFLLIWLFIYFCCNAIGHKTITYKAIAKIIICLVTIGIINIDNIVRCITGAKVESIISGQHWITYEPSSYNPYVATSFKIDEKLIKKELKEIKEAGFTGIITFNSVEDLGTIPKYAKEYGLHVIMGIGSPNNKKEIKVAIAQKQYVDAYAIGHNGLYNPQAGDKYTISDLNRAICHVRRSTFLPVSTTELVGKYKDNLFLCYIGDWIFPDTHIKEKDNVDSGIENILKNIKTIHDNAVKVKKPILLKMVCFPNKGFAASSDEQQAEFYRKLLDIKWDSDSDLCGNIYISVHSALDYSWKKDRPFTIWDNFTGLIDSAGNSRLAAKEITSR